MVQVNQLERDKMSESIVLEKLQGTLIKERASLSEVKDVYIATYLYLDGLTELNKEELSSSVNY
jgi:hypothetical protein